jgi:hypothetical protein
MKAAERFQQLVQSSSTKYDVFHVDLRPEWGCENENHRIEIRKGILEYLKQHHPDQVADSIWDLETPPLLKNLFVSISHCEGIGGFALCSKGLGLDIERTDRISQKIIDRISTENEIEQAPHFELLWPAKESVFKCSTEFYTISQIQITQWQKSQDETFSFTSLTANGWAFMDSTYSFALAIKKL